MMATFGVIKPFGWDHQYVYRRDDGNDPWNNPPISSTKITIKPNPDYIHVRGNFIFEPSDTEFESALCSTGSSDDSPMARDTNGPFHMQKYMNAVGLVKSILDSSSVFKEYSNEKFAVVAHRLISALVGGAYDFEILVHRHGKLYATHMVIRGGPARILFAKVVGYVAQSDLTLRREYTTTSSPFPVIYPEKDVPLGQYPKTYYKKDNIEDMFLPSDPSPYLLEFKMRHHLT